MNEKEWRDKITTILENNTKAIEILTKNQNNIVKELMKLLEMIDLLDVKLNNI